MSSEKENKNGDFSEEIVNTSFIVHENSPYSEGIECIDVRFVPEFV